MNPVVIHEQTLAQDRQPDGVRVATDPTQQNRVFEIFLHGEELRTTGENGDYKLNVRVPGFTAEDRLPPLPIIAFNAEAKAFDAKYTTNRAGY